MAHLDRRLDPNPPGKPADAGKVKDNVSGNSAEAAQHKEDESEIGDRKRDPDVPAKDGRSKSRKD